MNERKYDKDEGGTGASFWIIMACVAAVMFLLVYLFAYTHAVRPPVRPEKGKEVKPFSGKGKEVKSGADAILSGKKEPARKISLKNAAEYKTVSDNCVLAEEHLKYDRPLQAKEAVLKVLASGIEEGDPLWSRAVAVLNKVDSSIISGDLPSPEIESYIIQKGDSLSKIASDSNITVDMLMKINGLNSANSVIHQGRTLKVYCARLKS